jgi:uncharacterized repeat protein (TIGR01451 family)
MVLMVFSLASPGVAVFADESTETPAPPVIEEELPPAEVPPVEEETPREVGPVEEEEDEEATPDEEAVPGSEETPAEPADEVEAVESEKSAEVGPVTVAASIATPPEGRGARDDFPPPVVTGEYCNLTTTSIFWAGQDTNAGSVSVTQDETNVYVTFNTTGGWEMSLTQLYVGKTPPASYAPGSFPYQTTHNPKITSYQYTISLATLGASAGDTLYVAAHADVHNGERGETAWAGQGQWPGLLFTHTVGECEEPELGDVTVRKFNDLNENGERDEGEPYLSGWTFTLAGESVNTSSATDASGTVQFADLQAGSYAVDEVLKDGWFATRALPVEFELDEGESKLIEIGNAQLVEDPPPRGGDVTVYKFHDLNENGVQERGEPLLEGWTFTLEWANQVTSATTDASGTAVFGDLPYGAYLLDEVAKDGWFATSELPIRFELDANGYTKTFRIGNAQEPVTKTFQLVYEDAPEEAILYVDFYIDGEYQRLTLEGTPPTYTAEIDLPTGTVITDVTWRAYENGEFFILGAGAEREIIVEDLLNEFEYDPMASGFKFEDINANGEWDEGEPGLEGWLISLYRVPAQIDIIEQLADPVLPLGELVDQTLTAEDGSYKFTGLLPGLYYVTEENRAGWYMTVGPEGSFFVENGTMIEGLNFGNTQDLDLALTKEASLTTVTPGGSIDYTITYENVSGAVAEDFTIVDDYDETLVTVTDTAGGVDDGDVITWTLPGPLVAADGPQQITYTVQVLDGVAAGTLIENFAEIDHPRDENPENDTDDDVVEVEDPFLPFTPETPEEPQNPADPEPQAEVEEEQFLPYTGADAASLALFAAIAALAGLVLRRLSRAS